MKKTPTLAKLPESTYITSLENQKKEMRSSSTILRAEVKDDFFLSSSLISKSSLSSEALTIDTEGYFDTNNNSDTTVNRKHEVNLDEIEVDFAHKRIPSFSIKMSPDTGSIDSNDSRLYPIGLPLGYKHKSKRYSITSHSQSPNLSFTGDHKTKKQNSG